MLLVIIVINVYVCIYSDKKLEIILIVFYLRAKLGTHYLTFVNK